MQMLKIIKCSDGMRWYASKVGELVPYLGDSMGAYKSREDAGYINFVQYEDAEVLGQMGTIRKERSKTMNIQISNTNGVKDNTSYVRVYVNAIKVAEVSPSRRNPLGYMRQYKNSKYWGEMRVQLECCAMSLTPNEVDDIMDEVKGGNDDS